MEKKAKSIVGITGNVDVFVFSVSTKTLKAYRVNSIVEDEPGTYITRKVTTEITLSSEQNNDFIEVANAVNKIRANRKIHYSGNGCSSSYCLTTVSGMGNVTSWLTANFLLPAVFNNMQAKIINEIFKNAKSEYTISVCFDDGVCVEFKLVNMFSSYGWKTTGPVNLVDGSTSDNSGGSGISAGGTTLICVNWVTYKNTTMDGTYCEGWSYY